MSTVSQLFQFVGIAMVGFILATITGIPTKGIFLMMIVVFVIINIINATTD